MGTKAEVQEAKVELLSLLEGVQEIRVIFRHVSGSGMTRWLDLVVLKDGEALNCGYRASLVLGWGYSTRHNGVKVEGAGMDMGFHLVSSLCAALGWPYDKIRHRWL